MASFSLPPARWAKRALLLGLILLACAAIDPLEGAPLLVLGVAMVAGAAFATGNRHRTMLAWAFGLTLAGAAALWTLSAFGGIGGASGHSTWWALALIPFPVGIVGAVVGAILVLIDPPPTPA
jgi:hypothetical protein